MMKTILMWVIEGMVRSIDWQAVWEALRRFLG